MKLFKHKLIKIGNKVFKRKKVYSYFVVAIVILTVVFAALSLTLRINGTAKTQGKYSVHFKGYKNDLVVATNTGYAQSTVPTISTDKTELNDFRVVFKAPKDAVEFKFIIINDGNINAEISDIKIENGTFIGSDDKYASLIEKHMVKTLKYVGGSNDGKNLEVGDLIAAGEEQVVALTYKLTDFESERLFSSVSVYDLEASILYVQSSKKTTSSTD